jgi:hypothetical protein
MGMVPYFEMKATCIPVATAGHSQPVSVADSYIKKPGTVGAVALLCHAGFGCGECFWLRHKRRETRGHAWLHATPATNHQPTMMAMKANRKT